MKHTLTALLCLITIISCTTKQPYYSQKIKYKIDYFMVEGEKPRLCSGKGIVYGVVVFVDDSNFIANVAIDKPFPCRLISIEDSTIRGIFDYNRKIYFHISSITDINNQN